MGDTLKLREMDMPSHTTLRVLDREFPVDENNNIEAKPFLCFIDQHRDMAGKDFFNVRSWIKSRKFISLTERIGVSINNKSKAIPVVMAANIAIASIGASVLEKENGNIPEILYFDHITFKVEKTMLIGTMVQIMNNRHTCVKEIDDMLLHVKNVIKRYVSNDNHTVPPEALVDLYCHRVYKDALLYINNSIDPMISIEIALLPFMIYGKERHLI